MIGRILQEWKKCSDEKNILIYQMGKVGSTSLEHTIPGSIHLHSFYNHLPTKGLAAPRRNTKSKKVIGYFFDVVRRVAVNSRKKIRIITLVRDPFSRNVSEFFQVFAFWMYYASTVKKIDADEPNNPNAIFKAFNEVFEQDYSLTWFDKEFKRMTGVDVFAHQFDTSKSYGIINTGKYEIMIIKLERMNEAWPAIEAFANVKMELKNANMGSEKWYRQVYKDFMNGYVPTKEFTDLLYKSKLVTHFYSEEEIAAFRKKIMKNAPVVA